MALAPESILRAGNETIYWACVFCRSHVRLQPAEMVFELMDAIHEVPRMLTNWERHSVADVRFYLGCFNASQWPEAPDLVAYFDRRLAEYGYQDETAE